MAVVSHAIQISAGLAADPRALGPRLARIVIGFAAVIVAYWFYALAAVPLIEPRADRPDGDDGTIDPGARAADSRMDEFRELFPSGSWQLKNPKVLESGSSLVLFQGYRNFGGGRLEITPCTVIHRPTGAATPEEHRRRCIVLDAPDGALLQFDRPLELGRGEVGKLVGGRLNGWITIRSDGRSPGPEDDLRIITQNLELAEQSIWSDNPVDFRLGASYGRGREMHIQLLPDNDEPSSAKAGPSFGGLESFELRKVEQLHLEPVKKKAAAATSSTAAATALPASGGAPMATDLPIEISCKGPFRFNMLRQAATFQDCVDVLQIHPNGPSDKLTCDLLTIHFGDRRPAPPPNSPTPQPAATLLDLEARSFEATGEPAVITLPSQQAEGRAQRLEYDLLTGRIAALGERPVFLRQNTNQVEAVNLVSLPVGSGRFRQVAAQGPGRFRGQMDNRAQQQQIEATWNQLLTIQPTDQYQVVSLTGGAALMSFQFGSLQADQIHFRLMEVPQPGPNAATKLQLQHMQAEKGVRLLSPQFSALTEHLEVLFEQPASPAAPAQAAAATPPPGPAAQASSPSPAPAAGNPATPVNPLGKMASSAPAQHFEISGQAISARVILPPESSGGQPNATAELAAVTVENNVRLVETKTAQPNERPMLVTGERLEAIAPAQPQGTVLVVGRPAHFEARGLGLTGTNINLNRGTNRMWIDGPGQMDLPMDRDLEGRAMANAGTLEVHWRSRMTFDGFKASFEESVVAAGANSHLQTETLEVLFRQKVQFNDTAGQSGSMQQPDVEQILCRGGVWIESQTYKEQELTSIERMRTADLAINRTSGAVFANGPGWVWRVMQGSGNQIKGLPGARPAAPIVPPADQANRSDSRLRCLFVQFQGTLTGNLRRREFTFREEIRTLYDAVEGWEARLDPAHPESLSLDGAMMECNQLEVRQIPTPLEGRPAMEMEALGNAVVESPRRGFTARAIRIAYSEVNGMLKLEGDGRTDAVLSRQTQVGGPLSKTAAQRIFYWPATEIVRVDGARSLELGQFPDRNDGKR